MEKSRDAFRTISEVAEVLDIPAHVLRFWESRFPQIRPVKRAGGRRYYRPSDVALLSGIKRLLHGDGLTIRGVQKVLRENGIRHVMALADTRIAGDAAGSEAGTPDVPATADVLPFPDVATGGGVAAPPQGPGADRPEAAGPLPVGTAATAGPDSAGAEGGGQLPDSAAAPAQDAVARAAQDVQAGPGGHSGGADEPADAGAPDDPALPHRIAARLRALGPHGLGGGGTGPELAALAARLRALRAACADAAGRDGANALQLAPACKSGMYPLCRAVAQPG